MRYLSAVGHQVSIKADISLLINILQLPGKFTDAAKMPQVKVMRLLLQMISNSWATSYVGGAHPFHHEIPKAFVGLFKEKVVGYFMPSPGGDDKTTQIHCFQGSKLRRKNQNPYKRRKTRNLVFFFILTQLFSFNKKVRMSV